MSRDTRPYFVYQVPDRDARTGWETDWCRYKPGSLCRTIAKVSTKREAVRIVREIRMGREVDDVLLELHLKDVHLGGAS